MLYILRLIETIFRIRLGQGTLHTNSWGLVDLTDHIQG
jgi:hypothetical protein